jgi:hypothetical protein
MSINFIKKLVFLLILSFSLSSVVVENDAYAGKRSKKSRKRRKKRRSRRSRRKRRKSKLKITLKNKKPTKKKYSTLEKALIKKFGPDFITKLEKKGVTALRFMESVKTLAKAVSFLKFKKYHISNGLFKESYSIIKHPSILFWQSKTTYEFKDYYKAYKEINKFKKTAKVWDLTPIKASYFEEAEKMLAECKKQLGSVKLEINLEGASVYLGSEFIGKSPLKGAIYLDSKNKYNFKIMKTGYVEKNIEINNPPVNKPKTLLVELLTPEEDVKKNDLYKAQERKRKLIKQQLEIERIETEAKAKKRKKIFKITGYSSLGVGVTALIIGGISGLLMKSNFDEIEDAQSKTGTAPSWSDYSQNYDDGVKYRTIMYYSLIGGATLAIAGAVLTYIGNKPIDIQVEKKIDSSKDSKSKVFFSPMVDGETFGFSIGFKF